MKVTVRGRKLTYSLAVAVVLTTACGGGGGGGTDDDTPENQRDSGASSTETRKDAAVKYDSPASTVGEKKDTASSSTQNDTASTSTEKKDAAAPEDVPAAQMDTALEPDAAPDLPPPPPPPPPPAPYIIGKVGTPTVSEAYGIDGKQFEVKSTGILQGDNGNANDNGGAPDSLTFLHVPFSGDVEVVARLIKLDGGDDRGKAGVMFRKSLDPKAAHAAMIAARRHDRFQWRAADGNSIENLYKDPIFGGAIAEGDSVGLRLQKKGSEVRAWSRKNVKGMPTTAWKESFSMLGAPMVNLGSDYLLGLAVAANNNDNALDAVFDQFYYTNLPLQNETAGWDFAAYNNAIGASAVYKGGTYFVNAGFGKGPGNNAESGAFAFRAGFQSYGIEAEVSFDAASEADIPDAASAAIAIRSNGTSATVPGGLIRIKKGGIVEFASKNDSGQVNTVPADGKKEGLKAPVWLRIETVSPSRVTAYYKAKQSDPWTELGSNCAMIPAEGTVGLMVQSGDPLKIAKAVFKNVKFVDQKANLLSQSKPMCGAPPPAPDAGAGDAGADAK